MDTPPGTCWDCQVPPSLAVYMLLPNEKMVFRGSFWMPGPKVPSSFIPALHSKTMTPSPLLA